MSAPKMARRLTPGARVDLLARQAQVSVSAQNAVALRHIQLCATFIPLFLHPNEGDDGKQVTAGPVAMVAAVSSGAMARRLASATMICVRAPNWPSEHWFAGFGCTGGYVSPQLAWKNAPAGTRSFAVTVRDPEVTGSGWRHWTKEHIAYSVFFASSASAGEEKQRITAGRSGLRAATILAKCRLRRRLSRRREINRTAIALRYGRWMSPRCRWMPGLAGRWSAICYTAMLSPAHS